MASSEERREVAATLRDALGGHVAVECGKVAHALGLEYETHGMMYCFGSEAVRRLADLIEPQERTCHNEATGNFFCCSECGSHFGIAVPRGSLKVMPTIKFCPHCGARVVSGDGE